MLELRVISPLEKVFPDTPPVQLQKEFCGFRNEHLFFQLACTCDDTLSRKKVHVVVDSPLSAYITVRTVRCVPVMLATLPGSDDNYLRKSPGLYPDLLSNNDMSLLSGIWQCFFLEYTPNAAIMPGLYPVTMQLCDDGGNVLGTAEAVLRLRKGLLPPQTLLRTQWFHSDCLAEYYHVPVFSEEYWRIVENFMSDAALRGINMILTPVFTPPLDTAIGSERLTVQLVDVERRGNSYHFGFARLRRWIKTALRAGITHFEISHLFTQWGAKHAPKIVDVNGSHLFGWETDAGSPEYTAFLRAFLPRLITVLRKAGVLKYTYFHVSDEPKEEMLPDYAAAAAQVKPYIDGCPVIDALSDLALYQSGAISHPIPALNKLLPFVDAGVPDLWTYYCVGQYLDVPNQFIAMPSSRTRMLGIVLYRYDLKGFLQWGFNFYNSRLSMYPIDPYAITDADGAFPAGDAFVVYPGANGKPEESLRLLTLHAAMQDLRALQWLESLTSREHVLTLITEAAGMAVTNTEYPYDPDFFTHLRNRTDEEIEEFLEDNTHNENNRIEKA